MPKHVEMTGAEEQRSAAMERHPVQRGDCRECRGFGGFLPADVSSEVQVETPFVVIVSEAGYRLSSGAGGLRLVMP